MKEIKGDLIKLGKEGAFDVIVHGCNCRGEMGAGIALQIKKNFPAVAEADKPGATPGTIVGVELDSGLTVVNAYTQIHWGRANKKHKALSPINNYEEEIADSKENRYEFIRFSAKAIKEKYPNKRIGFPLIGCGLAGGDWDIVSKILEEEMAGCDATIVHFKKN